MEAVVPSAALVLKRVPASLPEDVRARKARRIAMGTGSLAFGVVSKGFPFWVWLLGLYGLCHWICCDNVHREKWPLLQTYLCVEELSQNELSQVQVVLFDGTWGPTSSHALWSTLSIAIVVWLGKSRCASVVSLQQDWAFVSHVFHHSTLLREHCSILKSTLSTYSKFNNFSVRTTDVEVPAP